MTSHDARIQFDPHQRGGCPSYGKSRSCPSWETSRRGGRVQPGAFGGLLQAIVRKGRSRLLQSGSTPGIRVQLLPQPLGIAQFDFRRETRTHRGGGREPELGRVYDADVHVEGRRLSGSVSGGGFCGLNNRYRVFFALEVDQAPVAAELMMIGRRGCRPERKRTALRPGILARTRGDTLRLKAAVSFVSEANAGRISVPRFRDGPREGARRWTCGLNQALGTSRLPVGAPNSRIFYSSLYRVLIHPSTFSM